MKIKQWETKQLDDVATFSSGGTPSKEEPNYWEGDYPWISAKDMKSFSIKDAGLKLTHEGLAVAKIAKKGSVLVLVRGMTLLKDLPVGYVERDVAFNQDIKALVAKSGVSGLFLAYALIANKNRILNLVNVAGHGTGRLDTTLLKEFPIDFPPLLEQCRIAEVLGVWDESIDLLERLIGRVRSRKQGLMQQLLTGKKRFKEFKSSKEDWEKVSFDNCVSSMTSGLSRKLSTQDIGIPVLRSSNIGEKYADFDDLKYWYLEDPQGANTKNYILDDGDILINFINSISQIGKACIFKNCLDRDCIYTTNILRIKPNTRISSDFFYLVTQTEQYRLYIQFITKPAINQASFTTKELKEFTFLLPPIPEQEKIAAVLSAADEEISTLEKQLAAYKQQKLGLMQQLLTGRIRI
jgi:type I restriction enzyme, S subunit